MTDMERFFARITRHQNGCWTMYPSRLNGYTRFSVGGIKMYGHRASYTMFVGPIPDGLRVHHICRNTSCVRPEHLEAITHRENVLRGVSAVALHARKTHCLRGHELTPENTYIWRTSRICRTCRRETKRRYLTPTLEGSAA